MALPTLHGVARLVADPELRFTHSGKAAVDVRLAFNSRRQNDAGEWVDGDSFFVRGTAWDGLAEHIAETLEKGVEVIVTGELKTDSWESNGQKREAPALRIRSIGPSLAFATAKVVRATRDAAPAAQRPQPTRAQQAPAADDPWATNSSSYQTDEAPF